MTAIFETNDRCKFIFFTHDGKEWMRFVDFWGREETVSLKLALKIFQDEKKKRAARAYHPD